MFVHFPKVLTTLVPSVGHDTRGVHMQEKTGEACHPHWENWPLRSTRPAEPAGLSTITPHWPTALDCPQNAALREVTLGEGTQGTSARVNQWFLSHCFFLESSLASSYTYPQGILLRRHSAMASHISNHFSEVYLKSTRPSPFALYIIFEHFLPSRSLFSSRVIPDSVPRRCRFAKYRLRPTDLKP